VAQALQKDSMVAPIVSLYFPFAQRRQKVSEVLAIVVEYRPLLHLIQLNSEVEPNSPWYLPAPQGRQLENLLLAIVDEYLPPGH
jgi:hypothetical protein